MDGEILQEAVNDTLQRMPYMGDAFVERDGDFYYAQNITTSAAKTACNTWRTAYEP